MTTVPAQVENFNTSWRDLDVLEAFLKVPLDTVTVRQEISTNAPYSDFMLNTLQDNTVVYNMWVPHGLWDSAHSYQALELDYEPSAVLLNLAEFPSLKVKYIKHILEKKTKTKKKSSLII